MAVLGKVTGPKTGAIHKEHVVVETLTTPSEQITIGAGAAADITVSIASEVPRPVRDAGVGSVAGLPSGVYIANIAVDKTNKTLTVTLINTTTNDVIIDPHTITIKVVSIA